MKKLLYVILFVILSALFSSCYPSYIVNSGRVLPKGESSLNINANAPLLNAGFAYRHGLGNNNEMYIQSSIMSNEIGFRHALLDKNSIFQSSIGIAVGNGRISYMTGEASYEPSLWDPTDTVAVELSNTVGVTLLRAPVIFSLNTDENKFHFFGHIGPTFSVKGNRIEMGSSISLGVNIKIINQVSLCVSPFIHAPFPIREETTFNFLGYKSVDNVGLLPLYNFGVMIGFTIGQV